MKRGWLRYLTIVPGVAVALAASPPPANAAGNAGLHVHKTVNASELTITPNIGVSLGVDKASAIPGDTLTYTAVVTNPTSTLGMGGDINAEAVADTDATVAYYWDELEVCAIDCGNGLGNPSWSAIAAFEARQPGYQPVTTPALHSGMDFSAQSMPRSGVTYPSVGDQILGALMSPKAIAGWTYKSSVTLTPAQVAQISDPAQTQGVRNVLHV
ncbi:MAG TPA: hypothetical protein VHQ03_11975, partial [Candidatus Dormibacteraeota bacterium]|nr:hypothetical protein [Candidatus Dormibacteraeota bacterium]